MSRQVCKEVFRRLQEDDVFLAAIMENADWALAGYDLTESERLFISQADENTLRGLTPSCFELADGASLPE